MDGWVYFSSYEGNEVLYVVVNFILYPGVYLSCGCHT